MSSNNDIIYNMDSPYHPTLGADDIIRHTDHFKDIEEFAKKAYDYSVDPSRIQIKELIRGNELYLKDDNSPVILYHFRTINDISNQSYISFDEIEYKKSSGNPFQFKNKDFLSFTFSNNYPLFGGFLSDVNKHIISHDDRKEDRKEDRKDMKEELLNKKLINIFHDIIFEKERNEAHSTQKIREMKEYVLSYENFDKDQFVIKDDNTVSIKEFAQSYRRKYGRKFTDDFLQLEDIFTIYNRPPLIFCCLFVVKMKKGIIVKSFSYYPEQDEVLIDGNKQYIIKHIQKRIIRQSYLNTISGNNIYYKCIPGICKDESEVEEVKLLNRDLIESSRKYNAEIITIFMDEI